MGTLALVSSLAYIRLITSAQDPSLDNCHLGYLTWELSLGDFRLIISTLDLSLGNLDLGYAAWDPWLGILGFASLAWDLWLGSWAVNKSNCNARYNSGRQTKYAVHQTTHEILGK